MVAKRVVLRAAARDDLEQAVDWLSGEAGVDTALAFVDAAQASFRAIGDHPGIGSPRWAHELDLPGLRSIRVRGHDWLIFYVERGDHLDVWRVLHGARDMGEALVEPDI